LLADYSTKEISKRVFLLFSSKLVQFSSNFFDLDANFFGIWPFLNFLRKAFQSTGIFLWKICSFHLLARRLLISEISAPQLASFFLKMLITLTTAVTLPVCAVSITISSAFVVSLGAVLATLIGQGL
jgi:hypothetical protein